jgi:hypothetical protein
VSDSDSMTWQELTARVNRLVAIRDATDGPTAFTLEELALAAIVKQGEYVIETRSNRELDLHLRLGALGAALQVFGHELDRASNTERPAVLAELLGYASAFAGFLGAP